MNSVSTKKTFSDSHVKQLWSELKISGFQMKMSENYWKLRKISVSIFCITTTTAYILRNFSNFFYQLSKTSLIYQFLSLKEPQKNEINLSVVYARQKLLKSFKTTHAKISQVIFPWGFRK